MNEILPSGQVVHLDNLKAPKPAKKQELLNTPSKAADTSPKQDTPSNTQDPDAEPSFNHVDGLATTEPRSPPIKLETEIEPSAVPSDPSKAPQSNVEFLKEDGHEDFGPEKSMPDASEDEAEQLAPHMRIPPPTPYVPLSMQDLDGSEPTTKPEERKRVKETVLIRQTAQGWVEVDEAKEKAIKEQKAAEDAAAGIKPELDTTEKTVKQEPDIEEKKAMAPPPIPSTQSQWQAFAGPPTGFQVSLCLSLQSVHTDVRAARQGG